MDEQSITRREVLAASGGVVALAVAGGLCGCQAQEKKPPIITTGVLNIGPESNYHAGTANRRFWMTHGIVLTNDGGTVLAIRPRCTHKGCITRWDDPEFRFVCPCHGSEFDLLGRVIKGPAERSLPAIVPDKQADGTLTVDLDKLYGKSLG